MLLRDAHLELSSRGEPLSEAQVLGGWIPPPLAAAFASWRLMQLPAPTDYELELMDGRDAAAPAHHAAAGGATAFGQRLALAAANLTSGLRAVPLPGSGASDGAALVAWMQHVVSRLNEHGG